MSYVPGLEGVVAVETQIAEPDRDGGALRYRGVDIEELCGRVPYERVWSLLTAVTAVSQPAMLEVLEQIPVESIRAMPNDSSRASDRAASAVWSSWRRLAGLPIA